MFAEERHRLGWTFAALLLVAALIGFAARPGSAPVVQDAWRATTGGAIHDPPVVTPERLVVASRNGQLDAFTPAGQRVWQAALPGLPSCPPIRAAGRVMVGLGDGRLLAYGLAQGQPAWSVSPGGARVGHLLTVGTTLLALTEVNKLWAFDAVAGRLLWARRPERTINGLAALTAESFAVTFDDGAAEAWSLAGQPLWVQQVAEVGVRWPTMEGQRLILTDDTGQVHALAPGSGREISGWRFPTRLLAPPATRARTAWAALADGTLLALTEQQGWRRDLPAPAASAPVIVGPYLTILTGRHLQVFEAETGEPVWRRTLESEATAPPRAAGRQLYFVTWGGVVGALEFKVERPTEAGPGT